MIRTFLALSLASLSAVSAVQAQSVVTPVAPVAAPGAINSGNIAAHKQRIMSKIQQRMGILQSLQSCVAAAQDGAALRSCEEQARAANGNHEKKC